MPVPNDWDAANSTFCSLGDSVIEQMPIGKEVVAGTGPRVPPPPIARGGPAEVQMSTMTAPEAAPGRAATLHTPGRPVPTDDRLQVTPPSRLTAIPQSIATNTAAPGPKKIW